MRNILNLVLFALALPFAGCADDPSPERCADVTCTRGVCDPDTGTCGNAGRCLQDEQCLPGWTCADGACAAIVPCTDDAPCARGVCVEGACVNAGICATEDECVAGYRCSTAGNCVEDPCHDIDCQRGVCNPDSRTCLNASVCTQGTQATDCLDGYFCYGGACVIAAEVCADLDCMRGVCDPATQTCVESSSCAEDRECLAGNYCAADGTCAPNVCDEQASCARGVCDPADGGCVNADVCAEVAQCLDGFSCVAGACVLTGQECGGTCSGTQRCVYDPQTLAAVCDEGPICYSARDCLDGRVCAQGRCGSPTPCAPDAFEPNDVSVDAVPIAGLPGNVAQGSICAGDIDVFRFHTDDSPLFRGTLVADLAIDATDVGAGELTLEVQRPDGTTQTASTDARGVARIELAVGALDRGAYAVRVRDLAVGLGGLRYAVFVDLVDQATIDACIAAPTISETGATSNTTSGASYLLHTSCTSDPNTAAEDVYAFTLAAASWVRAVATPVSGTDLAVAIRRRCEAGPDFACANTGDVSEPETVSGRLAPGDYYLVVEAATSATSGEYGLTFSAEPIICGDQDARCVDDQTSSACNAQGTAFEEEPCDDGCDASTGRCTRAPRDVCFTAIDASAGLMDVVDWTLLQNDYDPGPTGCVPDTGGTQTAGPDAVYRVDLPADHVLHATQALGSGDRGSLYLLDECGNLDSCLVGVNAVTSLNEELIYFNTTGATQEVWLVADTEQDAFGYNLASVDIEVLATVCAPATARCAASDPNIAETCQRLGTGWDQRYCSFGCVAGACAPITNDQCAGAVDLLTHGPFTGRIDEYSADYNPGFDGCTGRSASGPDALFSVTPAAGEIAVVDVTADFDVALWAATDCLDLPGTCTVGADRSGQNAESIAFLGDGVTTHYVVVDAQFAGSGAFTVSARVQQPTCTPGTALSCVDPVTLRYCTELGVEADYTCASTCNGAACAVPAGQVCPDPIVLTDGQIYTGTLDVPNTLDPGLGTAGACTFPSGERPNGSDVIFAVDLLAGDWLFADYDVNSSLSLMYLLSDCSDTDSCLARTAEAGQGSLIFEATADQRVYLVLDRTTSSLSRISYSVQVDVRRQDCTPGAASFCVDANTIQYCDNLGFTRQYRCDGTCTAGLCDTPRGDECIDPIRVQAPAVVTGDWASGENEIQPAAVLDGWCPFDDTSVASGPEDIYVVDLAPGDLLRATLTTNYGSAMHYILEDCADTSTCRDVNLARASGVVQYYSSSGGPAYVVVDATSTFNSASPYTLELDVAQGAVCAPGEHACSAGTLSVCDSGGALVELATCAAGCANPTACAADPGADTCVTAPLTAGTTVYESFGNLTDDVAISSSGCTGGSGAGRDLVYAVTAGPGDVIRASVRSLGYEAVQIYIASDCADPDTTCLSGARSLGDDFAEVFHAPATFGTYYVVAEATSSFSDEPFWLEIDILAPECVPGAYQCAPAGQSMLVCNTYGLWGTYPCTGGCVNDACVDPIGQACFDAIVLADGESDAGDFNVADTLNPGSGQVGACNFGTVQGSGADTIYAVDLLAGDVLEVTYTSTSSFAMIYLLSDCADTSTCLANTADGSSGALQYAATSDGTVYVVMDRSTSGTTTLTYNINVNVRRPNCTPGQPATCLDADTLQYCDGVGFLQEYDCGGAAGTCTAGACDTPTAEVCVDAGVLTDGMRITGDFLGADDLSPPSGTHGACTFASADAPDGVDHFYRVDLLAGQWLVADFATTTTGVLYLVADCEDIATCQATTAVGANGRLAYQAPTNQSLYLVMDRTTSGSSAISWTLDVSIGFATCTPGAITCAADGTTLQECNPYGLWDDWACATTCTNGACDQPSAEICADALVLTDGTSVMDDFGGQNNVDLGAGVVGACDFGTSAQPGTDDFYRVDLLAGQTLTADWTSTSSFAVVYLTTDCRDAASCIAASPMGSAGTLTYTATSAESVYVVVDRNLSGSTSSLGYTLDIDVN